MREWSDRTACVPGGDRTALVLSFVEELCEMKPPTGL
jgi:hypothetical protein